jgi:chitosanase
MVLTPLQKRVIEQTVNVFETASVKGNYAAIALLDDGPKGQKQVTYGRSQTTEFGKLRELLELYIAKNGTFSEQFRPYLHKIGTESLVHDQYFIDTLVQAGKHDRRMQETQDEFFDERYFKPALQWAISNGFEKPLSMLVIYDSFIHSGSILAFLRKRFPEAPPIKGGSERAWISAYVGVRAEWLTTHSNPILRKTVYRTKCMQNQIAKSNWDLDILPIETQGLKITGEVFA